MCRAHTHTREGGWTRQKRVVSCHITDFKLDGWLLKKMLPITNVVKTKVKTSLNWRKLPR